MKTLMIISCLCMSFCFAKAQQTNEVKEFTNYTINLDKERQQASQKKKTMHRLVKY